MLLRRQSNRDSARRTRQRKLNEVRELQEQVTGLARDKVKLLLHLQELKESHARLASRFSQVTRNHECDTQTGTLLPLS